eukprot:GHVS01028271.1.p1 GENE.GHVS01028271.1~~GHVS01028271.1.p1  ORF type:complete len:127 (+),score=46.83 GHVS01028271.1:282-662(+)
MESEQLKDAMSAYLLQLSAAAIELCDEGRRMEEKMEEKDGEDDRRRREEHAGSVCSQVEDMDLGDEVVDAVRTALVKLVEVVEELWTAEKEGRECRMGEGFRQRFNPMIWVAQFLMRNNKPKTRNS